MKLYEMPDIEVLNLAPRGPKLFIPGGWYARVATIEADTKTIAAYAEYLGTEEEAHEVHQKVYESGYIRALRLAIARRAQEYAIRFPDLVEIIDRGYISTKRTYATLRGFDPEIVQATFVPFDRPGRDGNDAIDHVFTELAQKAREAAV